MNAWDLVKKGHYEEAVALLSKEVQAEPSTLVLNNRGSAYLHLGKFDAALADFLKADKMSSAETRTACNGAKCGVALWMAGREEEAITTWRHGVEASLAGLVVYADLAGGVTIGNLLMFGATSREDEEAGKLAAKLLTKRLRTKQSSAWPGPASRYLLSEFQESEMLATVSTVPILRERQMCQAQFYIGVRALMDGDMVGFTAAIVQSFEFGRVSKIEAEYYLSLHEKNRIRV
jgi:tetratricopeptide (TPR) repeat protein